MTLSLRDIFAFFPLMFTLFVHKSPLYDPRANQLYDAIQKNLHIPSLQSLRLVQRYDIEGINEEQFRTISTRILSENAIETTSKTLDLSANEQAFGVEYLPGQYDQRADSAAQCIQIFTQGEYPVVATARIFILQGNLSPAEIQAIKSYTINAVDSRETTIFPPSTLTPETKQPAAIQVLEDFPTANKEALRTLKKELGLAMSLDDLLHTQAYFQEENRPPTLTEIRILDTYWSDHCRHTTFATTLSHVTFQNPQSACATAYKLYQTTRSTLYTPEENRQETLMDMALLAMKKLRKEGKLKALEVSDEINAASIEVDVTLLHKDGKEEIERWLVMFKNETHNHPTEIEPFGGAATCLGGCIRDPLSGRSYVYAAMRVTGASDPRTPFEQTLPGKLPQRKICQEAAEGYSSYGNQIGLATPVVSEIYHPQFVAKRLEIGAVVAAAPKKNVTRLSPEKGDIILLIGGRTGRDGIGGATGSSKEHTEAALENSAEVQKGNPPTQRKIQRLFSHPILAPKIKVCNDFGAGGVAVAIGEIAPSLSINLDAVPKKYQGLDGTEIAISESQERMAVCIDAKEVEFFKDCCSQENLECTPVATVTDTGYMDLFWKNERIVHLSRAFLDTNGVTQKAQAHILHPSVENTPLNRPLPAVEKAQNTEEKIEALFSDINLASQKGLQERFDSSIGAATVLSHLGGALQLTPPEALVVKIPTRQKDTKTTTHMAWGYDPFISSWSPFHGASFAVAASLCKLVASGACLSDAWMTFQEYFEKMGDDPTTWGKPVSALLGAFDAQMALELAAIGGKDSMSGSFGKHHVPPTLVSFALAPGVTSLATSPEFKAPNHVISLLEIPRTEALTIDWKAFKKRLQALFTLRKENRILSMKVLGSGGIAHGVSLMAFGNSIGAQLDGSLDFFVERHLAFLIESPEELPPSLEASSIGKTLKDPLLFLGETCFQLDTLIQLWKAPLEDVYPTEPKEQTTPISHPIAPRDFTHPSPFFARASKPTPRVCIPVFPGTNCEYDTAWAFEQAGAEPVTPVFTNLSSQDIERSLLTLEQTIASSEILMLPGGFSAGDEPDGSGKFIATILCNPRISNAILDLVHTRGGLILGICNGFQALIKTGLLPYGVFQEPIAQSPTLTFNTLGRHISRYAMTRVTSILSPWFANSHLGDIHNIAFSHGEGRFIATSATLNTLFKKGQVATQYCDRQGAISMAIEHNPNGSMAAIEAISSPCGRILGKMGHSERSNRSVAINIAGNKNQGLFASGVAYFQS